MTRAFYLVALLAIVALAFFLRTQELAAYRLSPDDGQYLHSARLHELQRGGDLSTWIAEDRDWLGELVDDWGRYDDRTTYQHSYLHQFVTRWLWRAGFARIDALRLSSAILGALACVVLAWMYRTCVPQRRSVGLIGALLVAVGLMFVFFSRTGWGEMGAATFLLAWIGLCWRLFAQVREEETGRIVRASLALCAVSLLAMGYHEMTSAYVVCGTLVVFLLFAWRVPLEPESWRTRGFVARLFGSRRWWAYVAACAPAGLYTLALWRFSEFAQKRWFVGSKELLKLDYGELRWMTLQRWWRFDLALQIGIPLLLLAAWGAWRLRTIDKPWGRYLVAWVAVPFLMYFFVFNDPSLERVYLPQLLVLAALAAEGVAASFDATRALREPIARGLGRVAVGLSAAGIVAYLGVTTWSTVFRRPGAPLFVEGIFIGQPDSRFVDRPWIEYLEDQPVHEEVGVWPAKDPLFVALDAGINARLFSFDEPRATWTPYLLGSQRNIQQELARHPAPNYRLLVTDRTGKVGLYVLERGAE